MAGELKLDKKSLLYLGIIIVIAILICVGFFYYLSLMPKIGMEEKISEDREYIYQNKVTSECSSESCWINDEGKKECTATFGKCQWINDNGTWKDFIDVVNMTFDYNSGDIIYSYKDDYSVTARLFLVIDVSQSVCEAQGWDWRSQDDACFLWWDQAKEFMEANGISYDTIIRENAGYYKYALNLSGIPQAYQDKLTYVGLRLEKANGLEWEDLKKQERSLTIKDKINLDFDDLIKNGFTYKLYDERTILIGNVSNKENLWLDPILGPAAETSDGYIYGIASDYSTARGTSFNYSIGWYRMSIGQEYEVGECTGTATDCIYTFPHSESACLDQSGCSWDDTICIGTPGWECSEVSGWDDPEEECEAFSGCVWDGCTGTPSPCSTWDYTDQETCQSHLGCNWVSDFEECWAEPWECWQWTNSDDCTYSGCTWDGCTGTPDDCIVYPEGFEMGECGYYLDCIWGDCWGTATACDDIYDETDCENQDACSWEEDGDYWVNRGYLSFDTSSIPDDAVVTDVRLRMQRTIYVEIDTYEFDIEIWKYDWVEPINDTNREESYDANGPTPAAAVYDADWKDTDDLSDQDFYYVSSSLDTSWIKLTDDTKTKYQLRSSRDVLATEPTDSEYLELHSADSAGHEPILSITYTENTAPTWGSIEVTPDPVNGGSPITVTADEEDDAEDDTLAIYCDESTDPSSDGGRYDVCSGTGFTSPYDIYCTGTALTGGTSHTIYCRLYDGTEYSIQKQYSYTLNQSPDKPTGLYERWGCCGGIGTAEVAPRTGLILNWLYSDPDEDPQAAYEIWVDDIFADLSIPPDLDPKFNHVVDPSSSKSYCLDLAADDDPPDPGGDWLPELTWYSIRPSSYWWKVRVKNSNGNWSDFSDAKSFTMPNRASPKVDFTPNPVNPRTEEEVTFIDNSECYLSDDSSYPCKNEFETTGENDISYEWDFDYKPTEGFDPDDSSEGDATHTYPEAGNYTIQLQITDIGVGGPFTGMCLGEVAVGFPLPTWKEITPF